MVPVPVPVPVLVLVLVEEGLQEQCSGNVVEMGLNFRSSSGRQPDCWVGVKAGTGQ